MHKPKSSEYVSFYQPYLDILPDDGSSLEELLDSSLRDFLSLTRGISKEKEDFAYQQGKWTIKQLVQHMIDAERVFAYRAMRFVRGDQTVLSGFDENAYADAAPANNRSLEDLIREFELLRSSNMLFFESLEEEDLKKQGQVGENVFSVKALGFICSGHVQHHLRILRERYL